MIYDYYHLALLQRIAAHQAQEAEKAAETARVRAEVEAQNAAYLAGMRLESPGRDAKTGQ